MSKFWIILICATTAAFASNSKYQITSIAQSDLTCGDAPFWDADLKCLFYVDLFSKDATAFRMDFATGEIYRVRIKGEKMASSIVPVKGQPGWFIMGVERKMIMFKWDLVSPEVEKYKTLFEVEQNPTYSMNRMHIAKCDPNGRVYTPTFNQHLCGNVSSSSLYLFENGKVDKIIPDQKVPNGMAWNLYTNRFYYYDTCDYNMKECYANPKTGEISCCREIVRFKVKEAAPKFALSGLTIDNEGFLYFCVYGQGNIYKLNPLTGKVVEKIKIPVKTVTSLTFAGEDLRTLVVTTSSVEFDLMTGKFIRGNLPDSAGSIFLVKMKTPGYPGRKAKV